MEEFSDKTDSFHKSHFILRKEVSSEIPRIVIAREPLKN